MQQIDSRVYHYTPPLLCYSTLGQLLADMLLDKMCIPKQRRQYPLQRETIELEDGGRIALEWVVEGIT